jgi:uncharacterized iron-regulated membrane protein
MPPRLRRAVNLLHLWIGLAVGLPAAILGLTGVVLMLNHPVPGAVAGGPVPEVDCIVAAARDGAPPGAVALQYDAPERAGGPATVRFAVARTRENPRGFQPVLVDPATGTVLPPPRPPAPWQRIVHDLHVELMTGGRLWVGIVGAVMAVMGATGLVLWWPARGRWRSAFAVRLGGSARQALRDLHGAAGFWGLLVFLAVSASGVYVAFPNPAGAPRPSAQGEPAVLRADAAVAAALAAVPGTAPVAVVLPRFAGEPYRVDVATVGSDRTALPLQVTVDGVRVLAVQRRAAGGGNPTPRPWIRNLHTGSGLGWAWWVAVFASGALPLLFIGSGTALWLVKRRNRARVEGAAVSRPSSLS